MAYGVRGKSSTLFAPSIYHGPRDRRAIALTFDDGPSESTPELLDVLDQHGAKATFFQCGAHVARLPAIARQVAARGHEIGNHTYSHPNFAFKTPSFMRREIARTQRIIAQSARVTPRWFRAPYGVRWPGLGGVQKELSLHGAMWSIIGQDWRLTGKAVAARVLNKVSSGAIVCLHDGRELFEAPDVASTIEATMILLPVLKDRGYRLVTISELLWPTT
jgi:peptidoglycan-N-acetylglucosamine deacetylase